MGNDSFDEFFERMMKRFFKDFEEVEKEFGIPKRSLRREKPPEFVVRRPVRVDRSGFSISISSNGIHPPKIEMKRFGPSGRWEKVPLKKEKIAPRAEPLEEKPAIKIPVGVPEKLAPLEIKEKTIPEYNVSVDIKEVMITLNAEGVESEDNVRVKFYPESVEIYAVSPKLNKGYFCTVAIPASIDKQRMTIEVEKKRVIVKIPRQLSVV